jgi:RNA polymerase sigma factor (sigma-70 family)
MAGGQANLIVQHLRQLTAGEKSGQLTDGQLLERFLTARDEAAFSTLVRRHGGMVLAVCRSQVRHAQDAEDLFQATFLVLAQRATSIRKHTSLACWLHGVAYRLSHKARGRAARQPAQEQANLDALQARPLDDLTWRELRSVLHEELERLPARYRAPLVLCYLQGTTQDEAARHLGWTAGMLRGRLLRGRDQLRARLTRRGLAPAVPLFAALLSQGTAPAAVPALLRDGTVRCAALLAAGGTATLPAKLSGLLDGMGQPMLTRRLPMAAAMLLALSLSGAGLIAYQGTISRSPLIASSAPPAKPAIAPERPALDLHAPFKILEDFLHAVEVITQSRPALDPQGDPFPAGAVARLGTTRFRHGARVTWLAFTRDGKTLASAAQAWDPTIRLWDLDTRREVRALQGHEGGIYSAIFLPDGKSLVSGSEDGTIRFWNFTTGKELRRWTAHKRGLVRVALSRDGKLLASGGTDKAVRLWDTATGKDRGQLLGHAGEIDAIAFSPDGKLLVSAGPDDSVLLWDPLAHKALGRLGDKRHLTVMIAFSPDGKTLASAGIDHRVHLWDMGSRRETVSLAGHRGGVYALAYSPDGKVLASGSFDRTIRLWDLATCQQVGRLEGHQGGVFSLAFSANGKVLASGGEDSTIRLWDPAAKKVLTVTVGHADWVRWLAFAADGRTLASGSRHDRAVCVWDLPSGESRQRLQVSKDHPLDSVAFSPDGKTAVCGCNDSNGSALRLFDLATGRELQRFPEHKGRVNDAAFAPDGKLLAAIGTDDRVHLWDPVTRKEGHRLDGSAVKGVSFSADGRLIAAIGAKIHLWAGTTGRPIRDFLVNKEQERLTFSPDGRTLASWGGGSGVIHLWEAATGQQRGQITAQAGPFASVHSVAFSPDGRLLAWGCLDDAVHVWDLAAHAALPPLKGHRGFVAAVAFSKDGKSLASGSSDTSVLVWDTSRLPKVNGSPRVELPAKQLESLWADLRGDEATAAYRAIGTLITAPRQAVPFIKKRLRPATLADPQHTARLIRELDSDDFQLRQKAARELEETGEATLPVLRKALAAGPSAEARRRMNQVLISLERWSGEPLRALRALEVLERIASKDARKVIEMVAGWTPETRVTREAVAALRRLRART